jgi:hypothetical protein
MRKMQIQIMDAEDRIMHGNCRNQELELIEKSKSDSARRLEA